MGEQQKVKAATEENSDPEGQGGTERREGRSNKEERREELGQVSFRTEYCEGPLVAALPAAWAHCCLSPLLWVFWEAICSSFCCPTLSCRHLRILNTSWQPSLLASSSRWKRHVLMLRAPNLKGKAVHKIFTH